MNSQGMTLLTQLPAALGVRAGWSVIGPESDPRHRRRAVPRRGSRRPDSFAAEFEHVCRDRDGTLIGDFPRPARESRYWFRERGLFGVTADEYESKCRDQKVAWHGVTRRGTSGEDAGGLRGCTR